MKKIAAILLTAVMMLTACAPKGQHVPSDNDTEEDKVTEITIPASYLDFTGNDAEETAEDYKAYCTDAAVQDRNVVLEVNEQQKQEILEMNQGFIDDAVEDFQEENLQYSYELKDDFSGVVYRYDESIESGVQAKMLMGVTSMYALNGIIESGNSEWSVKVTIENCHTGNVVAQGVLPDDSISFGQEEWETSYEQDDPGLDPCKVKTDHDPARQKGVRARWRII